MRAGASVGRRGAPCQWVCRETRVLPSLPASCRAVTSPPPGKGLCSDNRVPKELILPAGVPKEGRTLLRPGSDPFCPRCVFDLSITLLPKGLGRVVGYRHTSSSVGGQQGIFLGTPVSLQTFWHFPAPETLVGDLVLYLFPFTKSVVEEVLSFHLSLNGRVPLPGIPELWFAPAW